MLPKGMLSIAALSAGVVMGGEVARAADGDAAVDHGPWRVTLFGGRLLDNEFDELIDPNNVNTEEAGLIGVGLAHRLLSPTDSIDIEIEGQLVRHFGGQDHWEIATPVIARWKRFPWDEWVDSSAAFGLGLSLASEEPTIETRLEGATENLLAYWMVELEAAQPGSPYSLVGRIHHRSTAFGLFGEDGGSNALVLGIKRKF